jgi:hypothetical protein
LENNRNFILYFLIVVQLSNIENKFSALFLKNRTLYAYPVQRKKGTATDYVLLV